MRDFDGEIFFDDNDLAEGDEFIVDVESDGIIGALVELDDGAWGEFEDIAHGELAGTEANGELDFDVHHGLESLFFEHMSHSD